MLMNHEASAEIRVERSTKSPETTRIARKGRGFMRVRLHSWIVFLLLLTFSCPCSFANTKPLSPTHSALSSADETFLEDLEHRSFQYFWEQADPNTGLVPDRARMDGAPLDENHRNVASIAATGFGLTALCIAAERDWIT